jgi:hypothetical protein
MELDNYIRGICSSPEVKQFIAARAKATLEYKTIKETGTNKVMNFKYATYRDIYEGVVPALCKHGFGPPVYQTGRDKDGEWVMVGKLIHESGEWMSTMVPMREMIDKNGHPRQDNQSFESAGTYGKKQCILELTGACIAGSEEMEQQEERLSQQHAEIAKEKSPPPAPKAAKTDLFKRVENKCKTLIKLPAELAKVFAQAESLAESGDLTADEITKLRRQFGQLLPKEEEVVSV